jgi:hypothetical protein
MVTFRNFGSMPDTFMQTLYTADELATEQYGRVFRGARLSPEKRLMLAVLDDAVESFVAHVKPRNAKEQRQFHDARDWIMEADGDWLFSFNSVCQVVGIDPDYLRGGLERLHNRAARANGDRAARASRATAIRRRTALRHWHIAE